MTDLDRASTVTVTDDGASLDGSTGHETSSISHTFLWSDVQPRHDTQALEFVEKHPEYDGRQVRIGILDTGIFPTAHGLQFMSDGVTRKLLHVVDCTGSGDVDVSTRVSAELMESEAGERWWQLTSPMTGRVLKISAGWPVEDGPADTVTKHDAEVNPSENVEPATEGKTDVSMTQSPAQPTRRKATFGVGVKRAYELFPKALVDRCKRERQKKLQQDIEVHVTDLRRRLAALASTTSKSSSWEQTQVRDDLQARLDVLTSPSWNENDPGPLFDCLIWNDGQRYVAIVNVDEVDDLRETTPLICMEHGTLQQAKDFPHGLPRPYSTVVKCGTVDQMVLAINVYDDGKILSLVADCTPHGTHVAGIAAAAEGERSGVAPGSQLIGLKIGDTRLGSMETGAALVRALSEAVRLKCDVVNLSYGEGTSVPNSGRIVELIDELVWRHNILFVSSAGNNGPALSTVGAPGGTTESALGVGAYVSPAMMRAEYSLPINEAESASGTTFTWSSVGPSADGATGVDVIAPGGAITSVSHWCLQKSMLMNGTSMSSPHATGCVALLLSACKANNIPTSPARIKRAILNTAKVMPRLSPLQQGWGMIQVSAAWEYLWKHRDVRGEDVHFQTTVESDAGQSRGVYLRQVHETSRVHSFSVHVNPQFRREEKTSEDIQKRKIEFEMAFDVICNVPWIKVPRNFVLMNNGRSFKIEVDPTMLPPGLCTAKVCGLDSANPNRGVLFSLPITVTKPLPTQRLHDLGQFTLEAAETRRFFITPPPGSTWMDVTIRDCRESEDASPRLVVLHVVQLLPRTSTAGVWRWALKGRDIVKLTSLFVPAADAAYRNFEKQRYVTFLAHQHTVTSVSVEEGATVEVAIARYWSTLGETRVAVTTEFRGARPSPTNATLLSEPGGALVRLFSDIGDERVSPTAKLSKWRTPVRPSSGASVVPLTDRDMLPSARRPHELVLTYEFTQDDKGSVTPFAPTLQGVLYEAALESQLMLFFDGDKKYLGASDAFPSAISLPKGPITMRLQLRHEDPKILESLKDLTVWFDRALEKEISLQTYDSKERMLLANGSFKKRLLRQGESVSVYVGNPPLSKLPSNCKPGDMLLGSITYESGEASLSGDGKRPGGFPLTYVVGPKPEKPSSELELPEPKDERSTKEKMIEAVRELQVSYLGKLTPEEKSAGKFDELYGELEAQYPETLSVALLKLKHLDSHDQRRDVLPEIVAAADAVVALVDQDELALHFGRKSDSEDPVAIKKRKEMKDKRSVLTEALARKSLVYWDVGTEESLLEFDTTLKHLRQWMDVESNERYAAVVLAREERAGRYGLLLKHLDKIIGKEMAKDAIRPVSRKDLWEKRIFVLEKLGYAPLVENERRTRIISFPKSFASF